MYIICSAHTAGGVTPAAHGLDTLLALSIPAGSDTPGPHTQPGWGGWFCSPSSPSAAALVGNQPSREGPGGAG